MFRFQPRELFVALFKSEIVLNRNALTINKNICRLRIRIRSDYQIERLAAVFGHTSTPVPQQVAVDILDVGVDGGSTGDAAWSHVGVGLGVYILKALPGYTRTKL